MYEISRKTTKTGALTLTKEIRHKMGIKPGQVVDVTVNDDLSVTIRKHTASCHVCGSIENVKNFKNFEICENCRKEMANND